MPSAKRNSGSTKKLQDTSAIRRALENLAKKKLKGRDAGIVLAAVDELRFVERIRNDFDSLHDEMLEIEQLHECDLANYPNQLGKVDLAASILALDATCRFFRAKVSHHNLDLLKSGLQELAAGGSPAAMFHPLKKTGRRGDVPAVMAAKGAIAGMMRALQSSGMSRKNAAKWIVRHISPTLAGRISGKPLTPRMVEEWLDRFGGDFAENNPARKSYKVWSGGEAVDAKHFREITDRIAKIFPARKHR